MAERTRFETVGIAAALVLCAAFVISFVMGLGGGDAPAAAPDTQTDAAAVAARVGRIEVLNASRRSGMARLATRQLRDAGFDVVYYGNAPASAGDSSVVLDRSGRIEVAQAAATALGIGRVDERADTTLYVDVTVVVGADWVRRAEEGGGGAGWWRRAAQWFTDLLS